MTARRHAVLFGLATAAVRAQPADINAPHHHVPLHHTVEACMLDRLARDEPVRVCQPTLRHKVEEVVRNGRVDERVIVEPHDPAIAE
eukprot:5952334-Prymnesium_polylepis.1